MDPLLCAVSRARGSREAELRLSTPEGEMGRDHPGFDDRSVALGRDRVVAELVLEHRVKPEDALPPLVEGHLATRPLVSSSSP